MMKNLHKLFANSLLVSGLFVLFGIPLVSLGFISSHSVQVNNDVLSASDTKTNEDIETRKLIEKFKKEMQDQELKQASEAAQTSETSTDVR